MKKFLVSTKNISYGCGLKFLEKGRIVCQPHNDSRYIYRHKDSKSKETVPKYLDEFPKYFRDATSEEVELYKQGVKSVKPEHI